MVEVLQPLRTRAYREQSVADWIRILAFLNGRVFVCHCTRKAQPSGQCAGLSGARTRFVFIDLHLTLLGGVTRVGACSFSRLLALGIGQALELAPTVDLDRNDMESVSVGSSTVTCTSRYTRTS